MEFKISGVVREKESKNGVPKLLVRAFDKDLIYDDVLGSCVTDEQGKFTIGYNEKDFRELFERKPDIYLNIYGSKIAADPLQSEERPIYTTKHQVRFNADKHEYFVIEIPKEKLGDDSPGTDIITTPEPGPWQDQIDDYFEEHPVEYQFNPDKQFARPKLICTSNFGSQIISLGIGESNNISFPVTNQGNMISFSAYIELYEGPGGYIHPISAYRLTDYRVVTINPGETVEVPLHWTRLLQTGRIVGVCYDPFMDPRGFTNVEQYNPHITSIHYIH